MKFNDTSYEEYINNVDGCNLHPSLKKTFNNFPTDIKKLKNLLIYGPPGVGKYSQSLYIIKRYSPSSLKYEKKANLLFNKEPYFFKISDIHYEVDMSLLGCNSKQLWHELYMLIIDIITTKQNKSGIILCKNFHCINNELLEIFYSYMQSNNYSHINVHFFIITEEYSFINDNILNCCNTINIPRPPKTQYNKILYNNNNKKSEIIYENENENENGNGILKISQETKSFNITNIKSIENNAPYFKSICNKILLSIVNYSDINLLQFRELMYEILIFDINIYSVVWYILQYLINEEKYITSQNITKTIVKTYEFLKYYNNNYRPIFHLENYFLFLCEQIATTNNDIEITY